MWEDGHDSSYDLEWLKLHSYDPPLSPDPTSHFPSRDKVLWDKSSIESLSKIPSVNFQKVMESDEELKQWLIKIETFGFCTIDGVPVDPKDTEMLARRISFIRETHYGGFWDFTADLAHGDTAYTNLAIGAHTDTTYFTDPVGLQMFHLLYHDGTGGDTLLIDGFKVADKLRHSEPEAFEALSSIGVPTHSAGDPQIFIRATPRAGYPIIQTDPMDSDRVFQIRYNDHDRSVLSPVTSPSLTADKIRKFYKALRRWQTLLKDPKYRYWYKMRPGTALVFDNWRILHGRSSFSGNRRLCGAYINWDDYQSRVAVIADGAAQKNIL